MKLAKGLAICGLLVSASSPAIASTTTSSWDSLVARFVQTSRLLVASFSSLPETIISTVTQPTTSTTTVTGTSSPSLSTTNVTTTTSRPTLSSGLILASMPESITPVGDAGGSVSVPESQPAGDGRTFYVDFASGNNANAGTSASAPWKHAPGDPAATGGPASIRLAGGDTVLFRGGVSYRGSINLKFSGESGAPIIYQGTGYGSGNAILDGADPVQSSIPCPSQIACGGASNWQSLRLVSFTEPSTGARKLFDALGALHEAQAPTVSNPFFSDDVSSFAVVPLSQAEQLAAGRLYNPALAAAAAGQPSARIAIWNYGNVVIEREIQSVSGGTIYFDPTGVRPYPDRDGRAAIVGSVKAVTKPGLFAITAPGKAVVYPRSGGGTQFHIGTGRHAINLAGMSNVTIRGFHFARGTANNGTTREGLAIGNWGGTPNAIRIENNRFGPASLANGYGIVQLNAGNGYVVRGNRFTDLEKGSGARFGTGVTNIVVDGNSFQRLGRTGIYLQGVKTATVRNNVLADLQGVHGNGMSFYLANTNITVSDNCVYNTTRPATFHGDRVGETVNNLKFLRNIFIGTSDSQAALSSWGSKTNGVTIQSNILLGGRGGILMNASDSNVTMTQNKTSGILLSGVQPSSWQVASNNNAADLADAEGAQLSLNGCSASGYSGQVTVNPI